MSRLTAAEKTIADRELDRRIWQLLDDHVRQDSIDMKLNISPKRVMEAVERGRPADLPPPLERDWEHLTTDGQVRPERKLQIRPKNTQKTAIDEARREAGRPRRPAHIVKSAHRSSAPPLQPSENSGITTGPNAKRKLAHS